MTTNATEPLPLTEGQRLAGCFTLKRSLSALDDGAVWLGQDEVLGKEVTLHFVPPAILRDQRAVAELRQEVKRNRQLIHPNILRVYDYVEDGGIAAISMDKFDGQSIAELLRTREALETQEIQPWITQLAETLSDAHRIQLIHRDLAPDNVILKASGGILLANFGLSRSMHDALERAGLARGARAHLSYMSPQQIDGDRPAPTDDVYGLGALIFELLTGRPPFAGEEGQDLVPLIRKSPVPSINTLRAKIGKTATPASWQSLVEACLAKAPEQRPRSCGEVAALIASGKTISSTSSSVPAPSRTDLREPSAPSRSATVEIPTKDSTPSKDSPATSSSVKSNLPPSPPPAAPAKKEKAAPALSANYPDLDRPKSKTPVVLVGVAALVLGAGVLLRNLPEENPHTDATGSSAENAAPSTASTASVNNAGEGGGKNQEPPVVDSAAGAPAPSASPLVAAAVPSDEPEKEKEKEAPVATVTPEPPRAPISTQPTASVPAPSPEPVVTPEPVVAKSTEAPAPTPASVSSPDTNEAEANNTPTSPQTGTEPILLAANKKPAPLIGADSGKTPAASESHKSAPSESKTTEKPAPAATPEAPKASGETPACVVLPTLPPALPKLSIPAGATLAQLEEILAERQAAADKLAETAKAADAVVKESVRQKEAKQADVDQFKKTYDEKRKGFAQIIQTGASVESDTAKVKEAMEKAKAAALEAVKAAEAAERNYNEFISKSGEKLAAKAKAEGELRDLVFKAGDQSKGVDELNANVTKAESLRQQITASQRQLEQDKAAINAQLAKARAAEVEALRKANREKIAGIEAQIKPLEAEATKYKNALGQLKDLGVAGVEAAKPIQQQLDAVNAKISALQDEIKALNAPPVSGKHTKPSAAAPAPTAPTAAKVTETPVKAALSVGGQPTAPTPAPAAPAPTPAKGSLPPAAPTAAASVAGTPAAATGESAAASTAGPNSLGMKFQPVGNVQFAVYPTTREQFEVFAKATNLKNNAWQNPWFQQGSDHPVVNVTWREAEAFCKWLTEKERKNGLIKSGETYRLPSDSEWSKAVGLPDEKGATPEERDMGVQSVYPWGSQWPPPPGAGNYAGEETKGENPIQGYNDGYENTSPVGKFKPTATGLYDMSGNVWQWVSDDWNGEKRNKTLRGGSWYNGAIQLSLLSSCRIGSSPDNQNDTYGFRVVKASSKR